MTPAQYTVKRPGLEIAVLEWGTPPHTADNREVVVLAHGFPDKAEFWQAVAQELAKTFRVIAFDMRGCGGSTPLRSAAHFKFKELVEDLFMVIDATSPTRPVHLVGHDWGGIYGWDAIASEQGQRRIASFTTLSPSLDHMAQYFRQRLLRPTPRRIFELVRQSLRNSLMVFFALPLLPTLFFQIGLGRPVFKWMMQLLEPTATFPNYPDLKGNAIRFLGIYRANLVQRMLRPLVLHTQVPVQTLQADHDPFLPPSVFEQCPNSALNGYRSSIVDASHWAPLSKPVELAEKIEGFVRSLDMAVMAHTVGCLLNQPTPMEKKPCAHSSPLS